MHYNDRTQILNSYIGPGITNMTRIIKIVIVSGDILVDLVHCCS